MTFTLSDSISITAPAETVFAAATNWEEQHRWVFATRARADKKEGKGVGSSIWAFTGIFGIGFIDTMTITAWQPPYICDITHTGKVVHGTGSFHITVDKADSVFTWSEQLELPFGRLNPIAWVVVRPLSRWALRVTLRRFQKIVQK